MKSLLAFFTIVAATIVAVACGSGSSTTVDPNADGGGNDSGTPFAPDAAPTGTVVGGVSLKLIAPLAVTLPVGRQKDVLVTRSGDAAHAVALTVTGLPTGVTAMDATIGPMQASATLTLVADTSAVPSAAPITITVKGLTSDISATTTFPLTVTGAPGSLDESWGTKGLSAGLMETGSQATGIGLQKNGSVVVGGFVNDQMVVARYTTAGVLDPTFGTAGQTRVAPGGQTQPLSPTTKLVVDKNDASLIARQWKVGGPLSYPARFTAAGAPDTTFGTGGFGATHANAPVAAVMSDPAGNVLVTGAGYVMRQSSMGVVDMTFGISGVDLGVSRAGQALAIQSTGRIIVAGSDTAGPGGLILGMAPAQGSLDPAFATTGKTTPADNHSWLAVSLDKNDGIYLAGQETAAQFLVGKTSNSGVYDASFNGTGFYAHGIGDAGMSSQANDVVVQPDGKIIAVGNASNSGRPVMAVVRLLPSGALDSSFGKDGTGIVFLPVGGATTAANAVVLQPDGKILVAGHGDMDWVVARFWP